MTGGKGKKKYMTISVDKKEYRLLQDGLTFMYNCIEKVAFEEQKGKKIGEGRKKEIKKLVDINDLKVKMHELEKNDKKKLRAIRELREKSKRI